MGKPWVEKYRPRKEHEIVLDEENRLFLEGLKRLEHLPNLLIHGPPGTGKTTAADILSNRSVGTNTSAAQERIMHLNASDDRGLGIVRHSISQFANSHSLSHAGQKIIILDEADYMTPCAHAALKTLVEKTRGRVCFILICNYVCRISFPLRAYFIHLRFSAPPRKEVTSFLVDIARMENISPQQSLMDHIVNYYYPDVRSMVNALQISSDRSVMYEPLSLHAVAVATVNGSLKNLILSDSRASQSSPADVATNIAMRLMARGTGDNTLAILEVYCRYRLLVRESESLALDYFCSFVIPSFALSEHNEES